jgi:hypothetical protein
MVVVTRKRNNSTVNMGDIDRKLSELRNEFNLKLEQVAKDFELKLNEKISVLQASFQVEREDLQKQINDGRDGNLAAIEMKAQDVEKLIDSTDESLRGEISALIENFQETQVKVEEINKQVDESEQRLQQHFIFKMS